MSLTITNASKTAIIFGANSLVGKVCLSLVLESEVYKKVIAFDKETIKLNTDSHQDKKLITHLVDYENIETYHNLVEGDDLFCCLGMAIKSPKTEGRLFETDFKYSYEIARIALQNGVNQFIMLSSIGASDNALFFYNKFKGQLESVVKRMEFWSIHIFKPSFILPAKPENNLGASLAKRLGSFLDSLTGGMVSKYRPMEAEYIAQAMFKVAQNPTKKGIFNYDSRDIEDLLKTIE